MEFLGKNRESVIRRPRRRHKRRWNKIRYFVNHQAISHEILVIAVSYAFIASGAWDDGILGFPPSNVAHAFEKL